MQHLEVRKRQQWRYALILHVKRRSEPHERPPAIRKRYARRTHIARYRRHRRAHALGRVARDEGAQVSEGLVLLSRPNRRQKNCGGW